MNLIPQLQIRANSIVSYTLNSDCNYSRSIQSLLAENFKETENKPYSGVLTCGAKKRMKKALNLFVQVTERNSRTIVRESGKRIYNFKFAFLTLTLHSTDRIITSGECQKKCVEPFLKWLKQVHGVKSYIQKAELQGRGQVHYHITLDQFVEKRFIREKWNKLIQRSGYSEMYFKEYGHYALPSTKIEMPKADVNLHEYLEKKILTEASYRKHLQKEALKNSGSVVDEMIKDRQNKATVGGKVWDCSLNLKGKNAKYYVVKNDYLRTAYMERLEAEGKLKIKKTDHCYIYEFVNMPAHYIFSTTLALANMGYNHVIENDIVTVSKNDSRNIMTILRDDYNKHLDKIVKYRRNLPVRKQYKDYIDYDFKALTAHRNTNTLSLFDDNIPIVNILLLPGVFSSS